MLPLLLLGLLSAAGEDVVEVLVAGLVVEVEGVDSVVGLAVVGAVVLQAGSELSLATPVLVEDVQLEADVLLLLLLLPIAPCKKMGAKLNVHSHDSNAALQMWRLAHCEI